jgi:tetratricopeptide (TPR) repeat protein
MSRALDKRLREALERFHAQDLAGSVRLCREILRQVPKHPDALHLLGIVRLTGGNAQEAVTLLNKAIEAKPGDPAMLENLGVAYLATGNPAAAETMLRMCLRLGASHGLLYMRLGQALALQGKLAEAEKELRTAAARAADDPEVHMNLGNALSGLGRHEDALACYRKVLVLQPRHVDAQHNVGTLLMLMGRNDEAVSAYQAALAVAPDNADCHGKLGVAYSNMGRQEEAIACFRRALAINPDHAPAYSYLGDAYRHQRRYDEAVSCYEKALSIRPGFIEDVASIGLVRAEEGRYAEALDFYRRALSLDPFDADVCRIYGLQCLALGDFEEGWKSLQWRRARTNAVRVERVSDAVLPETAAGKTILLLGKGGIGDELFFLRYVPLLTERGWNVILKCNRKLKTLLQRTGLFGAVIAHDESEPAADWRLLVSDLPLVLHGDRQTRLPSSLRLSVLDERIAPVRERIACFGPPPYIGLTWRAGTPLESQRIRGQSLYKEAPLNLLARSLEGIPGTIIGVQRHPRGLELDALRRDLKRDVHDLSVANEDLEDMLAVLVLLDQYIGVSNTNMHLMAGIGRTARVLVPHPPEWRWMVREGESPWFPGFETYRQQVDGDWTPALGRLARDLHRTLAPQPPS